MNRHEFYDNLNKFKSLAHGTNYKYYNKIDLPNGTTRYFYTKAEWDAYQEGEARNKYEASKKAIKNNEEASKHEGDRYIDKEKERKKMYEELTKTARKHNEELEKKEKIEKQQKENFEKNKSASEHEGDRYESKWEKGILPSGTQRTITKPEQVYYTFMDCCNFVNYLKGHSSTGHINDSLYYGYNNEGMKEDRKAIEKAMKFMNTEEEKFKTRLKNDPNLNEHDKEQILREYEEVYKQNLLRFDEITKDEESFNKHRAKVIKERGEQTLYDKSKPFLDAIPAKYGEKVSELGNEIINGYYDNFIDYAVEDMKKEGFDDFYINQVIPIFKKSLSKKVYIYLRRIGKDIHNDEWDWIFDDK